MRARVAFDTLAYANKLKAAGVESKVAEVQAETNADMFSMLLEDGHGLATKQDISDLKHEFIQTKHDLEQRISSVESKLEQQILSVESRLEQKILSLESKLPPLESKLEKQISAVESRLEQKILSLESKLRQELKELETRLTLRLGGMIIGSMAVLTTILSLLRLVQ